MATIKPNTALASRVIAADVLNLGGLPERFHGHAWVPTLVHTRLLPLSGYYGPAAGR